MQLTHPWLEALQEWAETLQATLRDADSPRGLELVYSTGGFDGSSGSGGSGKRTVRVTRRRQQQSQPGSRPRAEASERDRPSSGGAGLPPLSSGGSSGGGLPPYSTGGGGGGMQPSGGGFQLPGLGGGGCGGCGGIGIGGIVLLLIAGYFLWTMFSGGGGGAVLDQGSLPQEEVTLPEALPEVQPEQGSTGFEQNAGSFPVMATPRPPQLSTRPTAAAAQSAAAPANTAGGDTWTIMLYQDADDKVLEQDIYIDLNEAERIGSNDNVQIVAQIDRYRGGYQADGNWSSAKRFYVTRDNDLASVGSRELEDLGEVNMADPNTLVDFVTWAVQNYPADKYVLILSDHGMGWPGGWSDPTAQPTAMRNFPLSQSLGDILYLHEIDAALGAIRQRTGIDKFELVGMDACLMGHIEVFSMLEPHARYAVASQETEPALGWAYTSFLSALQQNPGITGADLGQIIVQSYIDGDQRITDDAARAEFVGGGRPMGGLFASAPAAESVARQLSQSITLTAADLSQIPDLNARINDFVYALQQVDPRAVGQARSYAQSFTNIFGGNLPPSYIDLGHLALLVAQATRDEGIAASVQPLVESIARTVVAEKSGPSKPGATGISVYFPSSQLYQSAAAGPASYNVAAQRFVENSLWDEFLAYFYTGNNFQADTRTAAIPAAGAALRSPVAGGITISPITLSSDVAAEGQPVLVSADVSGENIGYIKLLVGYIDADDASIHLIDSDYLQSPDTRELNGVYYPDWGEGDFTLEFEWEPYVTAVTDGATNAVALFSPEDYGRTAAEAMYTVDGYYTFADGEERYARAYFRDGMLQQIFAYTNENFTGAPWEITPEANDRFTVFEQWLDLDASGNVTGTANEPGATVTFANGPLRWTELVAAAGDYVVGFIVEDLDGNQTASYTRVTVR